MTLRERWTGLSPRERNLVIAAGAVALVLAVYYSPLSSLGELSAGASEDDRWVQIRKIESYQKILARADAAAARGEELMKRYEQDQQRLIDGSTPTQVGAELQGRLSSMAADAGLNVLSSQILKEEELDGFRQVGVRLTLSGELDGVTKLLSSIETGSTALAVTHLEINRKLGASRRPTPSSRTPAATTAAQSPLTATMEVKTFMRAAA